MTSNPKPIKTVFLIGVEVPGIQAAEPMTVYYRGIIQPHEMTFNPNGAHRFSVVVHVFYRQIIQKYTQEQAILSS